MANPIAAMRAVAEQLGQSDIDYAFVGGCIVNLLLDYPALAPVRPTDGLDVVVEVAASKKYSDVEATFCVMVRRGALKAVLNRAPRSLTRMAFLCSLLWAKKLRGHPCG